jgi:SPW repeat-containing protein
MDTSTRRRPRAGPRPPARVRRTPPPEPPPDWREEAMSASALNALAGAWLILSPWILGYTTADAWWNPIVFGAIVAVLALVRAVGGVRIAWAAGVNMLIGAWLFVSAWWLAVSSQAAWNVGIVGVVIVLLAAWSSTAGRGAA